ncbi:MAG: glycine zipper family protein [Rhodocyclales bacterium]|nr:glycine zipper family protein [Rhodocyclales bacterium]
MAAAVLAGCASAPLGPTVAVMPAPNKPLEVFSAEERYCRDYADRAVYGQTRRADDSAVGKAVVGTAVGAAVGAAVGGREGAAVGAGGGLLVGSAAGAGHGSMSERQIQRRYDIAYLQCMYSYGNQVPGQYAPRQAPPPPPPPPSSGSAPPPPPPPTK